MKIAKWILPLAVLLIAGCGSDDSGWRYATVVEGTTVQVPALGGGQVVALAVTEGMTVAAGDLLVRIDTTELHLSARQLQASLSELAVQREVAGSALRQARSQRDYLAEKHGRIQALHESKSASRQSLDDVANALEQSEIAVEGARQHLQSVEARRVQVDAQLATVRKRIGDARITAPRSGIVTATYYETGEAAAPMTPVVEITDLAEVELRIYVSQTRLGEIRVDQPVTIAVDGSERTIEGRVAWISPRAEFTPKTVLTDETRTSLVFAVTVRAANPDGVLKHGMPVSVRM